MQEIKFLQDRATVTVSAADLVAGVAAVTMAEEEEVNIFVGWV